MRIIVIGAGICGLATARALCLRGAKVSVFEQAEAIREVGAGLQIALNGFRVVAALGLADSLRARAVRAQAVRLMDCRGAQVVRLDLSRLASRDYWFVHRADLIEALAQGARAAGARIRLLQRVTRVEPGAPARVHVASGEVIEADLVVAADGLHSVLRGALNASAAPFFTGQVAWRAVVPNRLRRGPEARVDMGPHRHVVSYPLRGGDLLNIVAVEERAAWSAESWSAQGDPARLRAAFADFSPAVREMLGAVESVHLWGLFRHPVARRWHAAGCALAGDAAHPTLPFLAQGASMALEDAWVLADALDRPGTLEARLAAYQERREGRARRVIDAATGNAWKYHLSAPPLRWAAHGALRLAGRVAPGW